MRRLSNRISNAFSFLATSVYEPEDKGLSKKASKVSQEQLTNQIQQKRSSLALLQKPDAGYSNTFGHFKGSKRPISPINRRETEVRDSVSSLDENHFSGTTNSTAQNNKFLTKDMKVLGVNLHELTKQDFKQEQVNEVIQKKIEPNRLGVQYKAGFVDDVLQHREPDFEQAEDNKFAEELSMNQE